MSDLISRQAAIDAITALERNFWNSSRGNIGFIRAGIQAAQTEVERLSAIDAVPAVHGRWEWLGSFSFYRCSQCCERSEHRTNYCHNCGAKMDGGRKDDENLR